MCLVGYEGNFENVGWVEGEEDVFFFIDRIVSNILVIIYK